MELKQIEVYKFEELSETAREKALNNHNENNDYYFLEENLTEYLSQLLEDNNIKAFDKKLFYSLSCCQGDGVCFEGNFEYKGFNINIKHQGHYYHSNSVYIEVEELEENEDDLRTDLIEILKDEIEEEFTDIFKEICNKIEKSGYAIIEEEQSEEYFKESCEANEYTFRENGEMENL